MSNEVDEVSRASEGSVAVSRRSVFAMAAGAAASLATSAVNASDGQVADSGDKLIGIVSRMIEERGVHLWSIYPSRYTTGEPTFCASLVKLRGGSTPFVTCTMSFDLQTSFDDICLRLDSAIEDMDRLAGVDGFEFLGSPRGNVREPWGSVV